MRWMVRVGAVVGATALTGCSSLAEPSLESALIDAGARPAVAACMAGRMTDRLSLSQLQKLQRLRSRPGEKTTGLSALEVIERVNRIGDDQVVAVAVAAGAACALTP